MTCLMLSVSQYVFEHLNSIDAKRGLAEGIRRLMTGSPSKTEKKHVHIAMEKLCRVEQITLKLLDF